MIKYNKLLIVFLSVVVTFLVLFSNISYWLKTNIYDSETFINTTVGIIQQENVRLALATTIVEKTLEGKPVLEKFISEPAVSALSGFIGSSQFEPILEKIAGRIQFMLTSKQPAAVVVDLTAIKNFTSVVTRIADPLIDKELPNLTVPDTIVLIESGQIPSIYDRTIPFVTFGQMALVLALLIFAGMVIFSDRRIRDRVLEIQGITLLIISIFFIMIFPSFEPVVMAQFNNPNIRLIVEEVYKVFAQTLIDQTIIVAFVGLIIAVCGLIYRGMIKDEKKVVEVTPKKKK